jgi:uncharacterized membrane protein
MTGIRASHLDAVVAAELREAQDANLLKREAARDAQRQALRPTPPAPKAAPKPPASGLGRAVSRSATPAPSTPPPPAPVIPPGHEVVPSDVLDLLLATSTLTQPPTITRTR